MKGLTVKDFVTLAGIGIALIGGAVSLGVHKAQFEAMDARIAKNEALRADVQNLVIQVRILLDRQERPSGQRAYPGSGASRMPSLRSLGMLAMAAPPPNDVGEYEEQPDVDEAPPPPKPREVTPDDVREMTRRLARINREADDDR